MADRPTFHPHEVDPRYPKPDEPVWLFDTIVDLIHEKLKQGGDVEGAERFAGTHFVGSPVAPYVEVVVHELTDDEKRERWFKATAIIT